MTTIKPLTKEYLQQASQLADGIFDDEPRPSEAFEASLDQTAFDALEAKIDMDLTALKYWVAVDDDNKVIGTVGFYELAHDQQEASWLGWYCVAPEARGQKIGSQLLNFMIDLVKQQGKHFLRLYTSQNQSTDIAQQIYEKLGFVPMQTPPQQADVDPDAVYLELKLN